MKPIPILKTKRLVLRPFRMEDVQDVYAWCSDPLVFQYMGIYPHRDIKTTEKLLRHWIQKERNYSWAITLEDKAIGEARVIKDLPEHGFELGITLNRSYWRKGYMKEALTEILRFLFSSGYQYAYAETNKENLAAQRLFLSLGFQRTGERNNIYMPKTDEYIDWVCFTLRH